MHQRFTGLVIGLVLFVLVLVAAPTPTSADPIRVGLFGTLYSLTETDRSTFAALPDDFATQGGRIILPDSYLPHRTLEPDPDHPGSSRYAAEHITVDQPFSVQLLLHQAGEGQGNASAGIWISGHMTGAFDGIPGLSSWTGGFAGTVDHAEVANWRPPDASVPPALLSALGDPSRLHIAAQVTGGIMNIVKTQIIVDPAAVPEPSTLVVLFAGVAFAVSCRRRARS